MYFVGLGLILLVMKYFEISVVANWSYWAVLAPFPAAIIWWYFMDSSGLSAKKAMDAEMKRKQARIDRNRASLGMPGRDNRK